MEGTDKKNNEWVERTSGQEAWECSAIVPLSDFVLAYTSSYSDHHFGKNLNPKRAYIMGRSEYS